jgi:hypothetical protein
MDYRKKKCLWWTLLIAGVFSIVGMSAGSEDGKEIGDKPHLFGYRARFTPSCLIHRERATLEKEMMNPPSKARAFFLSLLLPGLGEYYAGSKKMARVFSCTEVLLWATYFSFRTYGSWKKSDYQNFAVSHAGIDPSGKDHQYFVNIENYTNIREYNDAMLRQRSVKDLYAENSQFNWEWDSEASRRKYEKLRIASDNAYNRSLFVIGGIILNHIVSGIDALRLARQGQSAGSHRIQLCMMGLPEGGMIINLRKHF